MSFRSVIKEYGFPVGSKETARKIERCRRYRACGDINRYEKYLLGKRIGRDGNEYTYFPIAKRFLPLLESDVRVSDKCCDIMKKKPLHVYQKATGNKPIIATMTEESTQRKTSWMHTGCNAFGSSNPISKPMSFWTSQDVLLYLKRFHIPYSSIYGDIIENDGILSTTGAVRTGCMFCMFGIHLEKEPNRFQCMAITHPRQWDYCINKLGCGEVLDCIEVPYKPTNHCRGESIELNE